MSNIPVTTITFQDNATIVGDGAIYNINSGANAMIIEIYGTATTFTVMFETQGASGNWYGIQGVNLSTLDVASQTTTKGQIWQFDLNGLIAIRTRISTISGGSLSIVGRSVN